VAACRVVDFRAMALFEPLVAIALAKASERG
jgi:hypothetical protein